MRPRVTLWAIAAALGLAAGCASHAAAHWSYAGVDGPEHWATLDPAYAACAGVQQSPLDLTNPTRATLSELVFEYQPMLVLVEDNGHTVIATATQGCRLRIGDGVFPLRQLHFHTPSEHAVDGRRTAAEVHLVHDGGDGRYVVVGVLLQPGASNDSVGVHDITDLLPLDEGASRAMEFDPTSLLPTDRRVLHYHGSLTTPPCSETVSWYVFSTPVTTSESSLVALRAQEGMNARPLQELGDREIRTNR